MGYSVGVTAEQSTDEANNVSYVRAKITLYYENTSWSYSSSSTWGTVTVGGETFSFTGPKSGGGSSGSTDLYTSPWKTFNHNANGERGSVGTSGTFTGDYLGSFSPYNLSATGPTYPAINWDRSPGTPTFGTVTRSGTSYTVNVNSTTSPAGAATYTVRRSVNGGAYGDTKTGQNVTFTGIPAGATVRFQSYASNSDGDSGTVTSGLYTMPSVPSAPSTIGVVASNGLDLVVTVGASSSNGGDSGTPTYRVKYTTDGTTYSSPVVVSAGVPYTFPGMTPGLTYTFVAYATNSVGNSLNATSEPFLLTTGGKRWNGTDFVLNTIARRWNSSQWVPLSIARRWDGTEWVNLV